MSRAKTYIIIAIFLLAAFLRLYKLGSVPPSPSLDEVSIGYNAYSILKTGMDEYKTYFPLQLRAYDDFRPALYIYPVSAAIWAFGLNAFAVRLPSVIFSLVTLFFIYKTALLSGRKYLKSDTVAIWALAFAAISPWHIYISRLGHEVNLGLALFTAGAYALFYWVVTQKASGLYGAAICMALSLYGYQSEKIVLPFFGAVFILLFWRGLVSAKRVVIKSLMLFVLLALYAVVLTLSPQGLSRLHGTSATGSDAPEMQQARDAHVKAVQSGDKIAGLLTSKYVTAITIITKNYISHFSPQWMFTGGRRESHKVPDMGLLPWWGGILMIVGLWFGYRRLPRKIYLLLLAWIFTGPMPAAITTQAPHAMRAITMFAPLMIVMGVGVGILEKYPGWKIMVMCLLCILSWHLGIVFAKQYFEVFPKEQSDSFQYALGDALRFVGREQQNYSRVMITNEGAGYQSYMFFLFYMRFDPTAYHNLGGTSSGGYAQMHKIGNVTFEPIEKTEQVLKDTLYIADIARVPEGGVVRQVFKNKDGKPAMVAISL